MTKKETVKLANAAADELVKRFCMEDELQYKTPPAKNPWNKRRVCGALPSGNYVHVFKD